MPTVFAENEKPPKLPDVQPKKPNDNDDLPKRLNALVVPLKTPNVVDVKKKNDDDAKLKTANDVKRKTNDVDVKMKNDVVVKKKIVVANPSSRLVESGVSFSRVK